MVLICGVSLVCSTLVNSKEIELFISNMDSYCTVEKRPLVERYASNYLEEWTAVSREICIGYCLARSLYNKCNATMYSSKAQMCIILLHRLNSTVTTDIQGPLSLYRILKCRKAQ
ncbi:hypothetical protein T07_10309 [Trichinella nelsoni]|uniref:Apple domain-containing protein n=1 Tax=Trichinella nelsoni TaxID=6336 RepID=A0A0V0S3J3_9BILA|nr:hypothetical protein T07_10309 [Trichinella nelsoni]